MSINVVLLNAKWCFAVRRTYKAREIIKIYFIIQYIARISKRFDK